jgi:hypothetical protein
MIDADLELMGQRIQGEDSTHDKLAVMDGIVGKAKL